MPHATRGRDGRQEGRECSYYDLHCYLNNTLFHSLFNSFLILCFRFSLCSRIRRIVSHWGLALPHRLSMGSGTAANASRWGLVLPQMPLDGVWY